MTHTKITYNEAWENIFKNFKILDHLQKKLYFDITADEIKSIDGKEARLMTKIDHREHLPQIMLENNLSILAIKNGLYRIARTNPFIDIEKTPECEILKVPSPKNISSINPFNIKSESEALDIAYISGMLKEVFNENTFLTIRGRLRGELDFALNNVPYQVDGVQIEVDGGYEGNHSLHLIEAKIGYRSNINIRQLLYPELFWKKTIKNKKVKSYIFYYQDNIFRFIPFDAHKLCAIHNEERAFEFIDLSNFSLQNLQKSKQSLTNPQAPFPQADDFERIHSMFISLSSSGGIAKSEALGEFDLVDRQFDYYLNTLIWLDVLEVKEGMILSTPRGAKLLKLSYKERLEELAKIIFSDPICFQILKTQSYNSQDFIKNYRIESISTMNRRAQSIQSWIRYFDQVFN